MEEGNKAIAEMIAEIEGLKLSEHNETDLKLNLLEINSDLLSSLMMLELKKTEELMKANNYFIHLKILLAGRAGAKLTEFCTDRQ